MTSSLKKIIGYTFLVQVVVFGVGILNNVFISRWLGPEGFGVIATFLAIAESIHRFANVGLEAAVVYFLGNKRFPSKKLIGAYFIDVLFFFVAGLVVLAVFFNTNIPELLFKSIDRGLIDAYAWLGVPLLLGFMTYEYGIRIPLGLQHFKLYNILQFIKPVSLLILLGAVYWFAKINVSSVVILLGATWFLAGIAAWRTAMPFSPHWDRKITGEMVNYGKKVMIGNFINYFNYRADIFLIGFFLTQEMVGMYYVSVIVAERLLYLTQSTSTILFPAASASPEQQKKTPVLARINFWIVLIAAATLAALANWLIPFVFSEKYQNSVIPLIALLPGIAALSVSKILSADLASKGLPHFSAYTAIVNFIINIGLNILLIPYIGITGAALASTVSYGLTAWLLAAIYRWKSRVSYRDLFLPHRHDWQMLKEI